MLAWFGVRSGPGHAVGEQGAWDDGAEPRDDPAEAASTGAAGPDRAAASADDLAGSSDSVDRSRGAGHESEPEVAVTAPAAANPPAESSGPQRSVDPEPDAIPPRAVRDRLAGVLESLGAAETVPAIRHAAAAAARVAELPLDAGQRADLAAARAELAARLARRVDWLAERAAEVRVVDEQDEWEALLALDEPDLGAVVQRQFAARGWRRPLVLGSARPGAEDPAPLQRGARVRCRLGPVGGAESVEGRVVAVRGARITVKVDDARGLRFPSVDWRDCEPLECAGPDAAAWARHAHRLGLAGLATAWATVAGGCAVRPLVGDELDGLWRELAGGT